jgi:hypothetical protein
LRNSHSESSQHGHASDASHESPAVIQTEAASALHREAYSQSAVHTFWNDENQVNTRQKDTASWRQPALEITGDQSKNAQIFECAARSGMFRSKTSETDNMGFLRGFEITTASPCSKAISDAATPGERRDFIADPNNRLSPDVRSLWNSSDRVLAIGDQHLTLDIKQHTIRNMQAYAEAGARAIGMEFFPQRSQPDLDRYTQLRCDSTTAPEDLVSARQTVENLIRQAQESPDDTPEMKERAEPAINRLMSIVDAAIDSGIHPVGIEPNISRPFATDAGYSLLHEGMQNLPAGSQSAFETYTSPVSSREERSAARKTMEQDLQNWTQSRNFFGALDEARAAGFDFSGMKVPAGAEEQDSLWNSRLHDLRNRTWAEQTAKYLNDNPGARMLLFAGAQHFQYGHRDGRSMSSTNERLKELGIGTTVLQFAGGDFAQPQHFNAELASISEFWAKQNNIAPGTDGKYPPAPDWMQTAALRYTVPAQLAGVSRKEFAIRIAPEGPREADYVIHLPQ